jgi:hypothetical protein
VDLPHRVIDAAVDRRQPFTGERRGSEGAWVNPLINNSGDLLPVIQHNTRLRMANIPIHSGPDDCRDVIVQSIGLDKFLTLRSASVCRMAGRL